MKNPVFPILAFCLLMLSSAYGAERPNVLFIAVDDLKPTIGAYGVDAPTPNIDRLAAEGTTFLNAHCQFAVCAPSRASLMTGRSPDYTEVWDLKTLIRDRRPDIVTLPQYFKDNGYRTLGTGKIYDTRSVDKHHDAPSWSEGFTPPWALKYDATLGKPATHYQSPKVRALEAEAKAQGIEDWWKLSRYLVAHDGWLAMEFEDVPDNAYTDGAIGDFGVSSIHELAQSEQPFFLGIGFKKPHLPFVAPKKYWDQITPAMIELAIYQQRAADGTELAYQNFEELRSYSGIPKSGPIPEDLQRNLIHAYLACVAYIDAQVGKLLDALEQTGLADNTIIVLWGDHGWHLGDHGLWCKSTNFEQATRVPLIFAAPGGKAGQQSSAPAELVDIYPTLCQLAGLPIPTDLEGVSLAPVIESGKAGPRDYAMSQITRNQHMAYSLRDDRYRYVAYFKTDSQRAAHADEAIVAVELYDYENDPLETQNIANDPANQSLLAAREAALRERLKANGSK